MTASPVTASPQDEAARWVARMDADGWSMDDEVELEQWLALDIRRRGILLQAQALWMAVGPSGPAATLSGDPVTAPDPRGGFNRRRVIAGGVGAMAASIALGVLLWPDATRYRTAVGEIRRFPLSDGSTAAINTASTVAITLTAERRAVRIEAGEAWFQVAKDPDRPFVVEAGRVRVQAVGTAFSVRRRVGGVDVLVTEGVVEAWSDGAETRRIRLGAGSRAYVSDAADIREVPAGASSVDRTLAWRGGKIDLSGVSLIDAVTEFNRYNRRQLRLVDDSLASEAFDGVFRTDDPEGFARAIATTLAIPVDLTRPDEILIGEMK